ncbi:hypothetical protein BKI52_04840 [marine bacterium AO1-C]|nr:hypothetical protein BKI52_04840 [marine bacterium AO1-C]
MFKWAPYAFVRFVLFLILGICYYLYYKPTNLTPWISLFYSAALIYLLTFLVFRRSAHRVLQPLYGILAGIILFCLGVMRSYNFTASNNHSHLIHQSDTIYYYQAIVVGKLQERRKSYRTEIKVDKIKLKKGWQNANGRVMFYIRKDSLAPPPQLKYGDKLLIKGSPRLLESPKNPKQFNYRQYLARQNIYHQYFSQTVGYQKIGYSPPNDFTKLSFQVGAYCDHQLKRLVGSAQEYGIATALLLGVKDRLDNEVLEAYSSAGLMHLLAVSGLHVGFIFVLLARIFGPIQKVPGGKLIFALLVIGILWFYAFVTGLSASVLRAVTMFSVVAAAKATGRRTSIYNTLAVSAFILLIANPLMITSVGFQLSYLAVIGIVYMQPKIYGWLYVPNRLLDYFWQLTSVSIAAQIATFPLALYYFHQFPNYFLVSNVLVLPFASLLLGLGVATLVFSFVPYVSLALGYVLQKLIFGINLIIFAIDKLPAATSSGVYLRLTEMWLIYGGIIGILLIFRFKRMRHLVFAGCCVLLLISSRFYHQYLHHQQKSFAIFHLNRQPNLHFVAGTHSLFIGKVTLRNDQKNLEFNTNGYLWSKGIKTSLFWNSENSFQSKSLGFIYRAKDKYALLWWQGKTFLILQQYMRYRELEALKGIQTDYLIIQNRAVWSIDKLLKHISPQFIIIDSSNGFYRGKKLGLEVKKSGIPFHWVTEKGAFILQEKD